MTAVSNLVASAPDALNTLNELATALGNDASFSTTVTTSLGGKAAKASNLSDLADVSTARTNLGLGTMATQAASNVNITGGTLDGVTIDCGEFDAPPTITISSQPSAQTASSGAATFSVTASVSSGTVTYQWQRQALGTGSYSNISGATSASLALTGLTNGSNNADNYRVVVSATGATSVTSNAAVLTVAAAALLTITRTNNSGVVQDWSGSGTAGSPYFTNWANVDAAGSTGTFIEGVRGLSRYYWTATANCTVTVGFNYFDDAENSYKARVLRDGTAVSIGGTTDFAPGRIDGTLTLTAGQVLTFTATGPAGTQFFNNVSVSAA
jgi:hypothetical protein